MASGELSTGEKTDEWMWTPLIRDGQVVPYRKLPIKNKYVNICRKGRRFSMVATSGGAGSLSGYQQTREKKLLTVPE